MGQGALQRGDQEVQQQLAENTGTHCSGEIALLRLFISCPETQHFEEKGMQGMWED